jgi:hypothetical protein
MVKYNYNYLNSFSFIELFHKCLPPYIQNAAYPTLRAPLRGIVVPLRGIVVPLRGIVVPLRGIVVPLRGIVVQPRWAKSLEEGVKKCRSDYP